MPLTVADLLSHLTPMLLALLVVAILRERGALRLEALGTAPQRNVNIGLMDLMIGMWLLLAGMAFLLPGAIQLLALPLAKPGEPMSDLQIGQVALLAQATTQLPVCIYFSVRAATKPNTWREAGLVPRRPGRELIAGLLGFVVGIVLVQGTAMLFMLIGKLLEQETPTIAHDLLHALLTTDDQVAQVMMAVSAVVIAPVLEEVIFRGLVQTSLLNWLGPQRKWLVLVLAALLFGLIHAGAAMWLALPGLFVLGLVLGWLYEKHGSLWPCIIVHVLFNVANIVFGVLVLNQAGE